MPPVRENDSWVGSTATLIYGQKEAMLVDTFLTIKENEALVDWLAEQVKDLQVNLKYLYITHGHLDHYAGNQMVLERFPNIRVIATSECVDMMHTTCKEQFLQKQFPGQVPTGLKVMATPLKSEEIELEGEKIQVGRMGFTDTHDTTYLYVPSIELLVAGDSVYNGIYPYFGECTRKDRDSWIAQLKKFESLKPKAVSCGHQIPPGNPTPENITLTRKYIEDFQRMTDQTSTALELYQKMQKLHPRRVNPGALYVGCVRQMTGGK
jgi:glyoxylase-like metal-dependent hydrolase (beta-lactamase superfamily II)